MLERENTRRLDGFVQIDDAYLGGERNGCKRGRGSQNRQPFVLAVETDPDLQHPRLAVIEPVRAFDNASLADWVQRRPAPAAEAYTDGLACFGRIAGAGHAHRVPETGGGRAATEVSGARWVNIVLGNLKPATSGRYHAVKQTKYARRYLAEAAYHFNRRFRLAAILPRLMRAMTLCAPCPERQLRSATSYCG